MFWLKQNLTVLILKLILCLINMTNMLKISYLTDVHPLMRSSGGTSCHYSDLLAKHWYLKQSSKSHPSRMTVPSFPSYTYRARFELGIWMNSSNMRIKAGHHASHSQNGIIRSGSKAQSRSSNMLRS